MVDLPRTYRSWYYPGEFSVGNFGDFYTGTNNDQDENDTRALAALCQALLRLRDASRAALIVVHHVRKSINRHEIGSAFRGSSALLLLVFGELRPCSGIPTDRTNSFLPALNSRKFANGRLDIRHHTIWFPAIRVRSRMNCLTGRGR
jgi:hypothetical protein